MKSSVRPETQIFEIFEAIEKVTKPKDKLRLLYQAKEIDENIFKDIVNMVYGPTKFYVSDQTVLKLFYRGFYITTFNEFKKLALKLSKRQITGNTALQELQKFFEKTDAFHFKWYTRILTKDLRIGVGKALVNKVLSIQHLEKIPSPMLATLFDDISESALHKTLNGKDLLVEYKIDGFRLLTVIFETHVECYTRNGKRIKYLEEVFASEFETIIKSNFPKPFTLDGEVFSTNWNLTMSFSPARKTKLSKQEEAQLRYYLFDLIPADISKYRDKDVIHVSIEARKTKLKNLLNKLHLPRFIYVEPIVVKEKDIDAKIKKTLELTEKFLAEGWEGSVGKVSGSPYEFKRSKLWIKFKKFETLDLLVVGVERSVKNPNEIGALIVLYKGKQVRVAGLDDKQKREWFKHPDQIIGKIIEVKHMGETKHGKLRHPVFVRIRYDKDKPDA